MATITKTLSSRVNMVGQSEILLRFVGTARHIYRLKSGVFVSPERWSAKNARIIIPRIDTQEARTLVCKQRQLDDLCAYLIDSFINAVPVQISKEWLTECVRRFHHPGTADAGGVSYFESFDRFTTTRRISSIRMRQLVVVGRMLKRFELWQNRGPLTFENITSERLYEFDRFLRIEHTLTDDATYMEILQVLPECRLPQPRGQNTLNSIFTRMRAFHLWAIDRGLTTNNPFKHFIIEESIYGTPYYITIAERERIQTCNLSRHPSLAIQRDIFVFQCLIGCRVGDLMKMTTANIMDGAIEYVPRKTRDGHPVRVRVPLNETARALVKRYASSTRKALFPFISEQKYNISIKRIFRAAGITRYVTVINPTTRQEEKRKLCEIASSHIARRTFVGNLYKKVKDPNLVGALSGHKEGSRSFARYRDIDEDMRRELVALLENQ